MKTHLIWLVVAITALAAGTQLAKRQVQIVEKPIEVVKTKEVFVDRPVEVIREVPKEVVKVVEQKVEVPAEIPEAYQTALKLSNRMRGSKALSQKEALTGVASVSVSVGLTDDIKKTISEEEIRTKFEITLRRSGVPIDENSRFGLTYSADGFTKDNTTLVYTVRTSLLETLFGFREDGTVFQRFAPSWYTGNYGTVGLSKAREFLISDAESAAENFANQWLAQNPKK